MQHSIFTHNGCVTVENPATGNHRTFRIKTQPDDAEFAPGGRIVELLVGSDNERSYKSFGFVLHRSIHIFKKLKGEPWGKQSDFQKFANMLTFPEKYEREHGLIYRFDVRCRRCNRQLTTPESIDSGIGPECAKKS